jgi:hypothetical protein
MGTAKKRRFTFRLLWHHARDAIDAAKAREDHIKALEAMRATVYAEINPESSTPEQNAKLALATAELALARADAVTRADAKERASRLERLEIQTRPWIGLLLSGAYFAIMMVMWRPQLWQGVVAWTTAYPFRAVLVVHLLGRGLFWLRKNFRIVYSTIEVFVSWSIAWGAAESVPATGPTAGTALTLVGALYVCVRGLDNLEQARKV